jgi:hypothetical protein
MRLIPAREAADRLQLPLSALTRLRRLNQGPAWVLLGRRTYYTQEALDAWVLACTHEPSAPAATQETEAGNV